MLEANAPSIGDAVRRNADRHVERTPAGVHSVASFAAKLTRALDSSSSGAGLSAT